jgi:hypothetical protein
MVCFVSMQSSDIIGVAKGLSAVSEGKGEAVCC